MTQAPNARTTAKPLITFAFVLIACGLVHAPRAASAQTPQVAQTPPAAPPVAAQAAEAVRLDVIFTDKSGRTVTDLKPEDVRVAEDGAQQAVTRLAFEELPATFALLVDNSRSLGNAFDTILRTSASIVSVVRPGDEATVIRFVTADSIRTLEDFTDDRESLVGAVESMFIEGGSTAVVDAVRYGVERVAERKGSGPRRRAVVLITDGEDRDSLWNSDEVAKLLRRHDVQVFAIGFVHLLSNEGGFIAKAPRAKAVALMTRMAEESGGRAFFPKDAATLKAAVEEITRNLRAQHTLEYRPTNPARDGKFRKVQVKASGDRRVFARPGYFAEK